MMMIAAIFHVRAADNKELQQMAKNSLQPNSDKNSAMASPWAWVQSRQDQLLLGQFSTGEGGRLLEDIADARMEQVLTIMFKWLLHVH